ncbi:TPA: hypothetical protein PFE16_004595 [Kluyvera georgiana]|nr:hypothetical protein [Kluyvera georgiana]
MNDITALTQRLASLMQENSVPMSDSWGRLFDALRVGDTENERMARDLISRNGEIEGLRKRVEELEEIATDYGMKFQRAQDDLKKMALMKSRTVTEPQSDYFASLVAMARVSADKAMRKFPQPNYVLLKVAEEAGEVVQAGVHYAEKRMEWQQVEGEIVQLLAMLIRLVTEGDQINGVTPPAAGIQVIEGEGQ